MAVESFNPIQLQAFVAFKIQGHPQLVSKVGSGRNAIVLRLIVPTRQPQQLTWLAWIQQTMSLCLMIKREREGRYFRSIRRTDVCVGALSHLPQVDP